MTSLYSYVAGPYLPGTRVESPGSAELIDAALDIGRRVQQDAIYASDGSAAWLTRSFDSDQQLSQLAPTGQNLFDGAAGTAVFLSALAFATGQEPFRDLALSALNTARLQLNRPMDNRSPHGAGIGLPSVLYAHLITSDILQDKKLLRHAFELIEMLARHQNSGDNRYDILTGSAGSLVVLLAVYERHRNSAALESAIAFGDKLIIAGVNKGPDKIAWTTVRGKMLAGFAHGNAGIAYSLARLYSVVQEPRFRRAAECAIRYEDSLFSSDTRNWPNLLRGSTDPMGERWSSWCHGAAGIALSRLRSLEWLDRDILTAHLHDVLPSIAQNDLPALDTPCCGEFGRVETLWQAGRVFLSSEYTEAAEAICARTVRRARELGSYRLGAETGSVSTFHQGLAGIGYQLLRLALPDALPCVLVWE